MLQNHTLVIQNIGLWLELNRHLNPHAFRNVELLEIYLIRCQTHMAMKQLNDAEIDLNEIESLIKDVMQPAEKPAYFEWVKKQREDLEKARKVQKGTVKQGPKVVSRRDRANA